MDLRRLGRGEWVALAGAIVLLVSLFLPWYGSNGRHVTAWQAMTVDDVILALVAVAAIAAACATASRPRMPVPIAYSAILFLPAAIAAVLALWRLADPAPAVHVTRAVGAWLGAGGAVALATGLWTGMADQGPARRSESAEQAATAAAMERSELLSLPPDVAQG